MDKEAIGLLEETVGEARLVDTGLEALKAYEEKAPSFSPERRRFLKYCAGLIGTGVLSIGPVKKAEAFLNLFQKRDWKAHLMGQDLIRGPGLLIWKGGSQDFERHLYQPVNEGYGAVDYEVLIGTPICPVNSGRIWIKREGRVPGIILELLHQSNKGLISSSYAHLSKRIIEEKGKIVGLSNIIAMSGNSGYIETEEQPEHLHLQISDVRNIGPKNGYKNWYKTIPPGLNPFTLGIDRGKPVYWDTKTEMGPFPLDSKQIYIERLIDNMQERVKETDIDAQTKNELLKRRNPEDLRNYLEKEVLKKNQGADGKLSYKYLPGHFIYGLMLEVLNYTAKHEGIAMLPFPYPMLLDFYKKENPNVSF
ncbi:peptidoglycan DD-metalloendopeptidase family protein [Candidatus Woesearchaeota archaeon]|nr:peptidoglycan DD-metalloendopeptidase family protein [Candidatus Woesearchaeota archaeon]